MPKSAISTGKVDFVLPLDAICPYAAAKRSLTAQSS
nr:MULTISPECIES: chemotaxis protein CheB [Brasilonema]